MSRRGRHFLLLCQNTYRRAPGTSGYQLLYGAAPLPARTSSSKTSSCSLRLYVLIVSPKSEMSYTRNRRSNLRSMNKTPSDDDATDVPDSAVPRVRSATQTSLDGPCEARTNLTHPPPPKHNHTSRTRLQSSVTRTAVSRCDPSNDAAYHGSGRWRPP